VATWQAHEEREAALCRCKELETEVAAARREAADEREAREELAEDLEVVVEEKAELEELNYGCTP
jgi:hypothetical protein